MGWKSEDPEETGFLREYADLPDRTIGILGMVLVERRLKMAIKSRWKDSPDGKLLKQLLKIEGGPLGATGVQINIGYTIGLYDWETATDLQTCVKIRNAFAHKIDARDFKARRVMDLCANLKLHKSYPVGKPPKESPLVVRAIFSSAVPDESGSNRWIYTRTIEIVITMLWAHLGFPARLPPVSRSS